MAGHAGHAGPWRRAGGTALTIVLAFSVAGLTEGAVEGTAAAASSAAAPATAPDPAVRAGTPRPSRAPAGAVRTEARLRAAWADPMRRRIDLGADIVLRDCGRGDPG